LAGADHIDVKTVVGTVSLREFVAAALNYQPGWVTGLYHVRAVFVRAFFRPPPMDRRSATQDRLGRIS